jgi:hypothetical protein
MDEAPIEKGEGLPGLRPNSMIMAVCVGTCDPAFFG